MTRESFTLTIKLGNAAMRTPGHVAHALRTVAAKIVDDRRDSGTIMDVNGNSVGSFEFVFSAKGGA